MLNFTPIKLDQKDAYTPYLRCGSHRGCAYSFVNLYLWGRQQAAIVENQLVVFSQFDRKSVYTFPSGCCDPTAALEAIIHDAKERGIPCRLVGLSQDDCAALERLYPGKLKYHYDRDSFDYVYDINDLADLPGRKFQKKRNHLNRFRQQNPDHRLEPITEENLPEVEALVEKWYALREEADPHSDFLLERAALKKALRQLEALELEGLLLRTSEGVVAMTLGSQLSDDTFDIHFEKALDIADGAYPAINNGFARYLREKYPNIHFLNREDDLGIEGLRKAKLSYNPHHLVEKSWAHLLEDGYDY
jgi:hypothetical protein